METEIRNYNCYQCGKPNPGIFFCDEECHQKWMDEHPVGDKKKYTIKEMQEKVLGWGHDPKRWKPSFEVEKDAPVTYDVAKMIFG